MRGRVNSTFFVTRDLLVLIAMLVAGLADVVNVRLLVFISSALVIIPGVMALVMPGLGQPAVEWRRALSLLHGADTAPNLRIVRTAALSDFRRLVVCLPEATAISATSRINLIRQARVSESPPGTAIIRAGEESDAAYFILEGRAVAGIEADGHNRVLEVLAAGDFFGEIAALTGAMRTANVIAEETTVLFEVPADALRTLVNDPAFGKLIRTKMAERMNRLTFSDMPRLSGNHQTIMRDLRTQTEEMQLHNGDAP
jgi:CRP-like cAMP-binding protein